MKKDDIKKILAMHPEIKPHGTPLSRRDLLSQGYIATGGFFLMPSLLSALSKNQFSDACTSKKNENQPFFLLIDCAGGFNGPGRNLYVGGKDGKELSKNAYVTLGIENSDESYKSQIQQL